MGTFLLMAVVFTYIGQGLILLGIVLTPDNDSGLLNHIFDKKLISGISQFGSFYGTAILYFFYKGYNKKSELRTYMPDKETLILIPILLISVILISGLITSFFSTQTWLKDMESYLKIPDMSEETLDLMRADNTAELIVNIILLAAVPGVFEEIFFRGLLQNLFSKWTQNIHIGILLSSLIFSFIHFNLAYFFSYLFLSLTLGYLYQLSGSIYSNIFFHFLWNCVTLIAFHYKEKSSIAKQLSDEETLPGITMAILSIAVFVSIFIYLRKMYLNKIHE